MTADAENGKLALNGNGRITDDNREALLENDDEEVGFEYKRKTRRESFVGFCRRHYQNVVHFLVEDWLISGLLGVITAVLSIGVDVAIEYMQHYRVILYDNAQNYSQSYAFLSWVSYITVFTTLAAVFCHFVSKQAIGSGIPEVKVIMHGFMLKNYLTFKTLIAKIVGLTLTLGSGLPVGKEGPFVHMGAIVASLLTKTTKSWQNPAFFSNEGRQMEMLSSGCAVGIACTFSSPAGAVLYGIESTHKYFAVKNYWRAFFATTCSAVIFRFANAAIIPQHIAGTITAYYQTNFPNEVFLVEEIPAFMLIGALSGVFGALFVFIHRRIAYFRQRNRVYRVIFGSNPLLFTFFMAIVVGLVTYPAGLGSYIAGKLTFRESLADFIANCTLTAGNHSDMACSYEAKMRWFGGSHDEGNMLYTMCGYLLVTYFLVAICVSLAIPAGIFVPSFVIGACGGRLIGELMALAFPEGIRGLDGPQIYPGLYAVVGAAAYTGAVTHSLSIAVIVCETTGQLSPLLPVLIALMVGNAIASFLQPSVYESIIKIKNYPHLAELPPSRISVHTLKVEEIMVHDVVCLTKTTTYKELRDILIATPHLRCYPLVTDTKEQILLGSISRKYLNYLLTTHLGPDPSLMTQRRRTRTASEILGTFRRNSTVNMNTVLLTDRNISGSHLLAHSPLHDVRRETSPLAPLLRRQTDTEVVHHSLLDRATQLLKPIDLDEVAIDSTPFQLVLGTSLYKVHTLFSLLGLNHAYVTYRGQLMGVISLKELRETLENIYTRGAVPTTAAERKTTVCIPSGDDRIDDDEKKHEDNSSINDPPSIEENSDESDMLTIHVHKTPNDKEDDDRSSLLH
uniref:Chloride channel protein n=1 Tax=Steinernema glaseri TaxID=37863 RepID=A0A1I7ZFZ0_9BILA